MFTIIQLKILFLQWLVSKLCEQAYRLLYKGLLDSNLKRDDMWNSVEVHAIYALFYTMCTTEEGLNLLSQYFSSSDKQIYEPIFYLPSGRSSHSAVQGYHPL